MAVFPINSSNLDLSISMPGFASSSTSSRPPFVRVKELDMNQLPVAGAAVVPSAEEEESCINGGKTKKKLRLSKDQYRLLEESFRLNHTLNPKHKEALAMELKLKPRQVEVWFQNRRARRKLKQSEMECEYLKRWFGSLTEQNRRLRRELEDLKAMKAAPSCVHYNHVSQMRAAATTISNKAAAAAITATVTATKIPFRPVLSALKLQQPSGGC